MEIEPTESFGTMLSPIRAGQHTLRNRVIMGSMHTRLETEPDGIAKQIAFYAERARGEAAILVTGGFSPNAEGIFDPEGPRIDDPEEARSLRPICEAVQAEGSLICAQLLHAGRYAKIEGCVAPSPIRAPINRFVPREMTEADIFRTVEDFAAAAANAQAAGFDGVEIMGSEGYLINEFTVTHTNKREDDWGGSAEKRHRFPVEIVRAVRERCGPDFLVIYRISAADLVEGGAPADEIAALARKIEAAGADILNTGIGWHEARVPTIATSVPRAGFAWVTKKLMGKVGIPVITSNRINSPEVAEQVLAEGCADMVSLARPFLADPDFVAKAARGRADLIAPCIACNQACLDHTFQGKVSSCLVNPRAGFETELVIAPAGAPKRVAVVGAGPAGLSTAITAAQRGHEVVLFEQAGEIGGQLNMARKVPGKEEFDGLVEWFGAMLREAGVELRLNTCADATTLAGFDAVVVATGVLPRDPQIPGQDHPSVLSYVDVLRGGAEVGKRVAVVGAGGIGFDVSEFLVTGESPPLDLPEWMREWGVTDPAEARAGLAPEGPQPEPPLREITLLQRKAEKPGKRLGKTTGWIHRAALMMKGVRMKAGVSYDRIDDEGLHITRDGKPELIACDTVVLCSGQESLRELADVVQGPEVHVIGGADVAAELDAKRAIDQGVRLAAAL